ncbi:hypothetical protein AVEN_794-1 [Araneus ventricosus]|uniref:Tc1-like transposase DDE domain-containing protein n=1 Tax=Araneus ventricosus TaxID=182803 RepID=A0A4Y2MRI8_ARAVE|nr:hypothetical protein AVEN_794-1 [Araneus ventricosus]
MVWVSVSFNSQTFLALLRDEKNPENYQETLFSHLVPFVEICGGSDLNFQHDNPSKHVSKSTSQWLSSNMGSVLSGLVLSPDLNFIENEWGKFTNLVYQNSKQYSSVEVLQFAIEDVWVKLQP